MTKYAYIFCAKGSEGEIMFQSLDKKRIILWITVAVLLFFLFAYRLPYYIYKPGSAEPLSPVVEVENSTDSEGEMHLVTIQGGQAVPIQYLLALFQDYNDILPIDEVYPDGMSQDDYMEIQLSMMENSQEASTVVAYTAANKDIEITYDGIYVVRTIEGMPAHEVLKTGDKIVSGIRSKGNRRVNLLCGRKRGRRTY